MRVPILFWLAWQILKYTFLLIRWIVVSSFDCINRQGWWKSTAVALVCVIFGYLFVTAVRPDVSQTWRDNWRTMFENAPRIALVTPTPIPQPSLTLTNATPAFTNTPAASLVQPAVESASEPTAAQAGPTFVIPTLPPLITPTQTIPTFALPTLASMPDPAEALPKLAISALDPTPKGQSPVPASIPTLEEIPTLQPIPSPTPTPTEVPPTSTPTPIPTATSTSTPTPIQVPPTPTLSPIQIQASNIDVLQLEGMTHDLINTERTAHGIRPLDHIEAIRLIARSHSEDMATRNFFSHDNLEGLDPTDRGQRAGYDCRKNYGTYYTYGLAENIHQSWLFGSYQTRLGIGVNFDWTSLEELARNAVNGWMDSPGHRENILDSSYDRAGMGVAIADDGKVFFTQNFC